MNFLNTGSSANTSANFAGLMTSNSSSPVNTTPQKSFEQHLKNSIEPSKSSIEPSKDSVDPLKNTDSTLNNDDIEALADDIVSSIKELVEKNSDEELSDEELSESIDELINTFDLSDSVAEELKFTIASLTNNELSADELKIQELLASIEEQLSSDTLDESELSSMLNELKESGITDKELLAKIEDFQNILLSKEHSLAELKTAWANVVAESENFNSDKPELEDILQSTDTKQKLVDMISQLPKDQQEALAKEFQQNSNKSIEQTKTLPNDLLRTIEKSNELVNEKIDIDADVDIDESNIAKSKPSNIDEMISQLESSFKNTSEESTTKNLTAAVNAINVDGNIEQQALKDLNNIQNNAIKTVDGMPPKLTLNDNLIASQQLKEHLILMSKGGLGQAFMQLDPEELGAMSVRISMQNDQMNVQFQVQNSQAKDMLEQAMNKLKESLQEQGIELNQSDVEQQSQNKEQSDAPQNNISGNGFDDFDSEDSEVVTLTLNKQTSNGIDYYA